MHSTAELVKELALTPKFTILTHHEERLEKVLGRRIVRRAWIDDHRKAIEYLKAKGFYFIVTPEFALRFKYHAAILGDCVGNDIRDEFRPSLGVILRYRGDIPDSVLDKIEAIKKYDPPPIISVHSMEYLPIEVEKRPRQVEPVAVWWTSNPIFDKGLLRWKYHRETVGAVIGIWDGEKEVEIL